MRVHFAPDGAEERVVERPEGGTESLTVTRMTRWPFDERAVALAYRPSDAASRVLVVPDDGAVLVDKTLAPPAGFRADRPVIAATPRGLLVAYARCPSDFSIKQGELHIEIWSANGEGTAARRIPVSCPTAVSSAAALDGMSVVTCVDGASDGYLGVLVRVR